MLKVQANITVWESVDEEQKKENGLSTKSFRTKYTRDYTVHSEIKFPFGHPNLEGYVPSVNGMRRKDFVNWLVADEEASRLREANIERVDISITGDSSDWVVQTLNYTWERPHKSLMDHLELFRRWEVTNSGGVQMAEDLVVNFEGADQELNSLTRDKVEELYDELTYQVGRMELMGEYDF